MSLLTPPFWFLFGYAVLPPPLTGILHSSGPNLCIYVRNELKCARFLKSPYLVKLRMATVRRPFKQSS